MGRRLFQEVYASQERTDALGLPDLMVVSEADDPETADITYHAVHKSYFSKEKQICPYCQGTNTAETKIRSRKFKDILPPVNGKCSALRSILWFTMSVFMTEMSA